MAHRGILYLTLALALLTVSGCVTTPTPSESIRSAPMTAAKATGEPQGGDIQCGAVPDEAEPLIIDLPPRRRGDLEVLMREGIVAVKYDCESLEILKSCSIPGSYAYKGTLLKEEVIRLENADEIRANLPLSGVGVAAKLEGEIARGATLDLAMAMVGQQRAARYEVSQKELAGRCEGATHFVKSVYVGAFAMKRGERAKAAAAAELFGYGGAGASASDRESFQTDGDIDACRKTGPDASKPATGCGALLRLYLLPISAEGDAVAPKDARAIAQPSCPQGMSMVGGKCARTPKGPVCNPKTPAACEAPCASGESFACGVLGVAQRFGKGLPKSREAAAQTFSRGCALGHADSCTYLAYQYLQGKGVTANLEKAVSLAIVGCDLGSGEACFIAGSSYNTGEGVPKDEKKGFAALEQGCAAGNPSACTNLGKAYSKGRGVAPDIEYSFKLYLRACEGGGSTACYNVGVRYSKGKGTPRSDERASLYYARACELGNAKACEKVR